ncbi:hypothetical protein [Spiroplasma endosymbiont of Virgichneumon dumeticola]|uniref:hypothetical protein n=1 Tax=Spiroplasma endosymbiont of Virgichneumon dumeticola TaxID=3139323 RepID=UPI0035C9300F
MKNSINLNQTTEFKKNKKLNFNSKVQMFKITLTGILLGLAVASSLIEIPVQFMGVILPLRVFDSLIIAFAIPIIGLYYTLVIGIVEPWLHLLLDGDHPPLQIFFDNIANITFIISFYFIYYYLFKLRNKSNNLKTDVIKKVSAGVVLVPLNAIVAALAFALTLVVLYFNPTLSRPGDYSNNIVNFNNNVTKIFFILIGIEILRFTFIYILFSLIQRRIGHIQRYY